MKVIANNLSFKNKRFVQAMRSGDRESVREMARQLARAGADYINVSLSLDGDGDEKLMAAAVEAVQTAGLPLSIDSRNPKAHREAVKAAKVPLVLNYVSDEPDRAASMDEILSIAAGSRADVVLYALRGVSPHNADERLEIIESLIERAQEAEVPMDRLIVDPVIFHIGGAQGLGQKHALSVQETLYGLNELVEPPIRTTCWLTNISAGAPAKLRPHINSTYLAMLAGLGLWSAYMDALDDESMRTVRLIRALKDETLYSAAEAA